MVCTLPIHITLVVVHINLIVAKAPSVEGSHSQIDEEEHQQSAVCHLLSEEIALKMVSHRVAYVITNLNRYKLPMRAAPDMIPHMSNNLRARRSQAHHIHTSAEAQRF